MENMYDRLGGETVLRRLVERFYDIMDTDPAYAALRALHGADLVQARHKLFLFLSGWLGGPNLYVQAHGHPRLRLRHLPFAIDETARDQWMACMARSMAEMNLPMSLQETLYQAFYRTADFMRNQ